MAQERTAPKLAGFFKFTKIGQQVVGLVKSYRDGGDSGPMITLAPALITDGESKDAWGEVAIGLQTDLKFKITRADVGRWVSIRFSGTEPTTKGSPRKIYRVAILENLEEVREAGRDADMTHRNELYPKVPTNARDAFGDDANGNGDDLPF